MKTNKLTDTEKKGTAGDNAPVVLINLLKSSIIQESELTLKLLNNG